MNEQIIPTAAARIELIIATFLLNFLYGLEDSIIYRKEMKLRLVKAIHATSTIDTSRNSIFSVAGNKRRKIFMIAISAIANPRILLALL
jgi:hypothetical protein